MVAREPLWRLVANTYENSDGDWKLVVKHVFYGDSPEQATNVYKAHLKTDLFLSECTNNGCFRVPTGVIICKTELNWERSGAN